MPGKSPALSELITAEISAQGPITFARFLELALYHPDLGYYASGRARIGRAGDFFTNVSVGPVFGRVLAMQFAEMWERSGKPSGFTLVEQGANNGQLAADILAGMEPEFREAVSFCFVEPSAVLQAQQKSNLTSIPRVSWVGSLSELPSFTGVHYSNELIDALPFHLVQSNGSDWEEMFVDSRDGALCFSTQAPTHSIQPEASALPVRPAGTIAELRPAATDWIKCLAGKLTQGYILAIDYGYSREQLLAPHRSEGTFSCYQAHRRDAKPLEALGEKDITSHVDFTSLARSAAAHDLHLEGFTDQHHFMVGASESLLRAMDGLPAGSQKTLRALQTLLHPESMGTQFRYIAFSKGVPIDQPLSGFRYARDAKRALEID